MAITPVPPLDRTSATFRSDVDVFFGSRISNFVSEVNALAANLNSIAAGGAYAIPYIWGPGVNVSGGSSQATSNAVGVNNTNASGANVLAILQQFSASSSSVKGQIRAVAVSDPSRWLVFNVASRTDYSTYQAMGGSVVAASHPDPFANNELVMLFFQRTGDKGDQGPAGTTGYQMIASFGIGASVASVNFANVFTTAYDRYVIAIDDLLLDTLGGLNIRLAVGGSFDSSAKYQNPNDSTGLTKLALTASTAAAAAKSFNARVEVWNANGIGTKAIRTDALFFNSGNTLSTTVSGGGYVGATATTGFQLFPDAGSITSGMIRVFGIKNTP